jgi:hypothetical protein
MIRFIDTIKEESNDLWATTINHVPIHTGRMLKLFVYSY